MKRRSLLFVPGNNKKMIKKALSKEIDTDCVILDLEDSVPFDEKANARTTVTSVLKEVNIETHKRPIYIRINQFGSAFYKDDLILVKKQEKIDCIILPKAEQDLSHIHKETGKKIIPIIETGLGVVRIEEIARSEGIAGLTFGTADLALSLHGSLHYYDNNPILRMLVVIAARAYGLDPIDKVCFDISNLKTLRKEAREARAIGFSGKLVIHPIQVDPVNRIFTINRKEIEWAKKVVAVYNQMTKQGKGAINLEGELVDMVHYKLAKKILDSV